MSARTEDPRAAFGDAVLRAALDDPRVVVLSADSGGSSGFGPFARRLPERYLELGIQEHGATGVASGLATMGWTPVFCAIAPFVTCRNFEAFRNDLGYMRQNVKIVGRNGGFTYSDLGATHHSLEDYAIMRMIPGVTVLSPQDPGEIRGAVTAMLAHDGPVYMRLGSEPMRPLFDDGAFAIGRARRVREGGDLTVVTTGHIAADVVDVVDVLCAGGAAVDLLCLGTVWPLDEAAVLASAGRTGRVVTVEEHYVRGGLGGAVCELLADRPGVAVHRIGVPHDYVTTGPYEQVRESLGLDRHSLLRRLRAIAAGTPDGGRAVPGEGPDGGWEAPQDAHGSATNGLPARPQSNPPLHRFPAGRGVGGRERAVVATPPGVAQDARTGPPAAR